MPRGIISRQGTNGHDKSGGAMQQVASSKKYQDGIQVFWSGAGDPNGDFYSYDDLINQKINVFDLLIHPGIYRIDPDQHRIDSTV
ncbi:MAG: hypothetical protein WB759_08170 [Methanoregula sp.]|uniref:hypothetical protein n=1 Tax=Methanoregula sp. TaxID=2052170 RepID=UPI003BD0CA55